MLSAGTRLGPYEIVSRIGAGGMGEVFRARDTRLDRSVAIKVLPSEFASNTQLKQRFEREARSISQLNHPHICTLHDVGSHDGIEYLVMELIDGETLADRVARGPLPLADVLRYGAQVAEALHVAHRAGIVHRDLKPGNVMITRSGAKLLDFGLARGSAGVTMSSPGSSYHPSGAGEEQATAYKPLTAEGTILGTFQYMAPEQLEGTEADARTDIFALGAVLYEMLTGKRAFDGKSRTSLIAAIVGGEPRPIGELQPLTPAALEHVVQRCLAKDPDERWQSAHDVAKELNWISEAGSRVGVPAQLVPRRRHSRAAVVTAFVVTLVAMSALAAWFYPQGRRDVTIESTILPPDGYVFNIGLGSIAAAPDGSALAAVVIDSKGVRSIVVRPLSAAGYRFLAGTEEGLAPFWSPDSRRIAFFAAGRLKVVDATGGPVESIADAPVPRGGAWASDGTIIFAPSIRGPLMRVPPSGGTPVPATKLGDQEISHRFPAFFPNSERFVFVALVKNSAQVMEGSLKEPSVGRLLVRDSDFAHPTADGWLLYARGGSRVAPSLVAQKLNRSHELTGTVALVADNVAYTGSGGGVIATADGAGNLFFSRGVAFELSELVWVDRDGKDLERLGERAVYFTPSLSRDGRRMAVDVSDPTNGQGDIWIHDLARKRVTRLTYEAGNESSPLWADDDKRIVYVADAGGVDDLYQIAAGGTGAAERLYGDDHAKRPTAISHDGQVLLFYSGPTRTARATDIWLYSFAEKTARPWLATPFAERGAVLSPDGKWIAYQSDETGKSEVYVRAFPDSDEKWPVSTGGGMTPAWRGDGRELYYIDGKRKMMAVKVNPGTNFEAESPVELFATDLREHAARQYDVTPDGTRFLLNRVAERAAPQSVTLVQNWTARLRQ